MPTRRQRRVNNLLQEELSELLQRRVKDPRLEGLTITAVEASVDLRHAHVYVSSLGSEEKKRGALAGLRSAEGFLRHELGMRLSLRYVPELTFHIDESLEQGERIERLLRGLEE